MNVKTCFKCGRELPLSSFYRHPQTADGHLNKCIDCAKKDSRENIAKKSEDIEWRRKERERGREKYRRLGYKSHKMRHPETKKVSAFYKSLGLSLQGCELHHWNYNFLKDVIAIPISVHRKLHNMLMYDDATKCFFHKGVLLTSKEEHIKLIQSIA